MTILAILIPITLALGAIGLCAFFWCLGHGQYQDLRGDAERILFDREDAPLAPPADRRPSRTPSAEPAP